MIKALKIFVDEGIFLVTNNHPPIIIYEEDRKEYYDALEIRYERQNLDPMKELLVQQLVKTWDSVGLLE